MWIFIQSNHLANGLRRVLYYNLPMNLQDIQRLHTDGFLAAEVRDRIIAHYKLQDAPNRFIASISAIGGVLVADGSILRMAVNGEASYAITMLPHCRDVYGDTP